MMLIKRKWWPLHSAIAWVLTRDEQFCQHLIAVTSARQRTFCAVSELKQRMTVECFTSPQQFVHYDQLEVKDAKRVERLAEEYIASLSELPAGSEDGRNGIWLFSYLERSWESSFREIVELIADEGLEARGQPDDGDGPQRNQELPSTSINDRPRLDVYGSLWEGPEGVHSTVWRFVTVNGTDLRRRFPEFELNKRVPAEAGCRAWLAKQMLKSPDRRPNSKIIYYAEACALFPNLGKPTGKKPSRSFERAWEAAMDKTGTRASWERPGRPDISAQKSPR